LRTFLRVCPSCGIYSLRPVCTGCGLPTVSPAPARFSPEDHYGVYRRRLKRKAEGAGHG
jgi:H/ACA ribonucleoprotein complex subunit 3